MSYRVTFLKSLLLASLLAVAVPAADAAEIGLQLVAEGLDNPVGLTHAGDSRLFILEQRGRVIVLDNGQRHTFLDIRQFVTYGGEQGFLGLAFHPRFKENRLFYVYYIDRPGDTAVVRYEVNPDDPNAAITSSARSVLAVNQSFFNHKGGDIKFGPDGYLYIPLGDGGAAGDPNNRAQNTNELLGKILRIDVDSATPYAIPPSNPLVGKGGRPEIWAFGLRNPWRISFDRLTHDLWIADVGQGSIEEVNFQPASSPGGENYGWRRMEGPFCFNPSRECADPTLTLPVLHYPHDDANCSVTGGYRYRGTKYPRLQGTYIYGDFCSGIIWGATPNADGSWSSRVLLDTTLAISSFGEDVDGELYVVNLDGSVYSIHDTMTRVRPSRH